MAELADVNDRSPAQVFRADLLLRQPLDPYPARLNRDRLPSLPSWPRPIEHCFQTAKDETGLDHYQARRYDARCRFT